MIGINPEEVILPDDNGVDYPDGEWADGWKERCGEGLFEKNRKYIVNIKGYGDVECVWNGYDFYPNEINKGKCIEGIRISGIVIGYPLNNEFTINSVREWK